ncbi:MAG: hydroxymethylglutaryl-CoA lyase [Sphingobium sp.]
MSAARHAPAGQRDVTIVEVGLRDGLQPIADFVPTATKIELLERLHAAGVRRVEVTAFVSDVAVPQLADATELVAAAAALPGLDAQVLVPNLRHAERALAAGARHLAFVLSVSEKHNRSNVRRSPMESVGEYARIVDRLPEGVRMRLYLSTAFDCPFDGAMPPHAALALMDELVPILPDAEICPGDTTGRVTPDRIAALFASAMARFPQIGRWAYHGHDTYGLGVANALAAIGSGVRVIDGSVGGLGGCPFAPGATGNVATEDLVWTLEQTGLSTGIDLDALAGIAHSAAALPGALPGGRVRHALTARQDAAAR